MSKFVHGLLQVLGVVVQVANAASGVVPVKYQGLVASIVAAIQSALALYNHQNPQGAK
jgi:hypothetical protein